MSRETISKPRIKGGGGGVAGNVSGSGAGDVSGTVEECGTIATKTGRRVGYVSLAPCACLTVPVNGPG